MPGLTTHVPQDCAMGGSDATFSSLDQSCLFDGLPLDSRGYQRWPPAYRGKRKFVQGLPDSPVSHSSGQKGSLYAVTQMVDLPSRDAIAVDVSIDASSTVCQNIWRRRLSSMLRLAGFNGVPHRS